MKINCNKTKIIISAIVFLILSYLSLSLPSDFDKDILINLRIPRYLGILLTGFSLSTAGFILQLVTKNPLADPFIIGTSGASMLGIILCSLMQISFYDIRYFFIIIFFSLSVTIFSYKLSYLGSSKSANNILLSGIAINSFILSLIVLLIIFSREWSINFMHISFGSFSYSDYNKLTVLYSIFFILIFLLFFLNKYILVFSFDDDKSKTLGIDSNKIKFIIFVIVSFLTSISVSISQMIGFIGLMIPHITRSFLNRENFNIIFIFNLLYGGLFLLMADVISRMFFYPLELPPGVISSIFGSLFFIWLILRKEAKNY
ncbi:MAG: iron ABC transporter permease [Elusimicrobiota bacterium]